MRYFLVPWHNSNGGYGSQRHDCTYDKGTCLCSPLESRQSFSPLMASSMLSELTCISCCPACSCIYKAEKKDATRLDSITSSVPAFWLTTALQPLCRSASMAVSEMQVLIVTMHPERALASCCSCSRTPRLIQTVTHLEKTGLPQVLQRDSKTRGD